ncbi:MAG: VOC family protein [Candidatus Niyogibacteria bacterium]|nr:VOC family protein [Candidatus Niyogibacteria bacterium]
MSNSLKFDHVAIPLPPYITLKRFASFFKKLGFRNEWYRARVGNQETAMETFVMTRDGVKLALMAGIDGKNSAGERILSQVSEYFRRFGASPQHIALRCDDIEKEVERWLNAGVRFLTEDDKEQPQILRDRDSDGEVFQCFTYPLWGSMFFELKQIARKGQKLTHFEEFRESNVEDLWAALDRALKEGWLFNTNLWGETLNDRMPKPPPRMHFPKSVRTYIP